MENEQNAVLTGKIIDEYAKAAFCNICDFYEMSDGVLSVKPLNEITTEATGAIACLKQTKEGVEIKLYDKFKALEAIAKILGLTQEVQEDTQITVNHNIPRPENDGGDRDRNKD